MTYNTGPRSRGTAWTLLCGDGEGDHLSSIEEENQEKKSTAPLQSSKRGQLKQPQCQHSLKMSTSKSSQRDEAILSSKHHSKSDKENCENSEVDAICSSHNAEPREKGEEGLMCDISFELSGLMAARGGLDSDPVLCSTEEECNETAENDIPVRFKDTVLGDSDSLKKDLALLGVDKMLDTDALSNVKGASQCIHELLSERTRQIKFSDSLNQEFSRMKKELESLHDEKGSLVERFEAEQRSCSFLRQCLTAAEEDRRADCTKWKDVKEEMESTNMQLRQRVVSYRATLRKKELEYQRLQDALCRKETKDKGVGTRVIQLSRKLEFGAVPVPMTLNTRESRLEKENDVLRSALSMCHDKFVELRQFQTRYEELELEREELLLAREVDWAVLPERVMGMPVDWLRRYLGDPMAASAATMKDRVEKALAESNDTDDDRGPVTPFLGREDLSRVSRELRKAKQLICEQQELLHAAVFKFRFLDDPYPECNGKYVGEDTSYCLNLEEKPGSVIRKRDLDMMTPIKRLSLPGASPATTRLLQSIGLQPGESFRVSPTPLPSSSV